MGAVRRDLPKSDRRSLKTAPALPSTRTTQSVPFNAGPRTLNRTHSITADVEIPAGGVEGALVSYGGTDGGYSLYIKDGKLQYVQNYVARDYLHVESTEPVPTGHHELRFEFEVTGPTRYRQRQRYTRSRSALHRQQAGRAGRIPAHHTSQPGVNRRYHSWR